MFQNRKASVILGTADGVGPWERVFWGTAKSQNHGRITGGINTTGDKRVLQG